MENCKVISITNQKGGVDNTTATLNFAVGLPESGKKVLFADTVSQISLHFRSSCNIF